MTTHPEGERVGITPEQVDALELRAVDFNRHPLSVMMLYPREVLALVGRIRELERRLADFEPVGDNEGPYRIIPGAMGVYERRGYG